MTKKIGRQTAVIRNPISIKATAAIVGPKEGEGPLGHYFDSIIDDEMFGEKSWEKAESKLMRETFGTILKKAGKTSQEVDYLLAGDLLDQCIGTNFALRESEIPIFGLYGACSTMAESMILGTIIIDGGFADNVVCITSSHFCSAEKQFRYPLELGVQRPPTAQWTVTGSGGVLLSNEGSGPYINFVTTGILVDMGIKDANNMGGAMAPAAADTILAHFHDTGLDPSYYDLVITGDLAQIGSEICCDFLRRQGYDIRDRYNDCGLMIYDRDKQDAHAGASGCACSATVLAGYLYKEINAGNFNNILFISTGALMSPTSTQQGETIPCVAHAVSIGRTKNNSNLLPQNNNKKQEN